MSGRAKLRGWLVIGLAFLVLLIVVVDGAQLYRQYTSAPHPATILTQPQVREAVDSTWNKRRSINKAFMVDATPNNTNSIQASPAAKISPKAGTQFRAVAGQIQSPALRIIFGLEGSGTYRTRRDALAKLEKHLSPGDLEWLYAFLASTGNIKGLSIQAQDALKDGLMVFLMNDAGSLPTTVEVLRQIYIDPTQDPTVRNYAVQYLANAVLNLPAGGQKAAIQQMLVTSAQDSTSSTSGAALLGLNRLSEYGHETIVSQEVAQIALANANNQTLSPMDRMTPLQICGQKDVLAAAPAARDLATNGTAVMVRMAALATLGQVGNVADIPLLTQSTTDPDERIRKAAGVALLRLKTKLKQ